MNKYIYEPTKFKDIKEVITHLMYKGSLFYKKEELTFQHLLGVKKLRVLSGGFIVETLELSLLESIIPELTFRKEISKFDLWQDQLKNTSILCRYHPKSGSGNSVIIIIVKVIKESYLAGEMIYGVCVNGHRYHLECLTPVSKEDNIFASKTFIKELKNVATN